MLTFNEYVSYIEGGKAELDYISRRIKYREIQLRESGMKRTEERGVMGGTTYNDKELRELYLLKERCTADSAYIESNAELPPQKYEEIHNGV